MEKIPSGKENAVRSLFDGNTDTLIKTYLEGKGGICFADSAENPSCALLKVGDFIFIAGGTEKAGEILEKADGLIENYGIIIPPDGSWEKPVKEAFADRAKKNTRWSFIKSTDGFDREKLRAMSENVPQGYEIHRIDEGIYEKLGLQSWSGDLTQNFSDCRIFLEDGVGFVASDRSGDIAAGVSSYTVFDGGIEIEIDTRADRRRMGLAKCLGAKITLWCLEEGLIPSWDAANRVSKRIAEGLGFRLEKEYDSYEITKGEYRGNEKVNVIW